MKYNRSTLIVKSISVTIEIIIVSYLYSGKSEKLINLAVLKYSGCVNKQCVFY